MINTPNDETTPSGASRGDDSLDLNKMKPFLLISRVYKSCIGNFAQMDSILVEPLVLSYHLTLSNLIARGVHLLGQTTIKHLLTLYQNAIFNLFH